MLPDIVSDHVTDASKKIGCQFTESLFYQCALEHGFGARSEDKARELNITWARKGYKFLPQYVKDFVLRVNNGEHV